MSTRKKAATPENELGEQVASKIAEQHHDLVARNWTTILETMEGDDDREVKITFSTVVTNREAEPGTVASKDSRIKTTMAMPLGKLSDSIDSPFPIANQPDLKIVSTANADPE